jgi:small-conductance mechanosensitive channel
MEFNLVTDPGFYIRLLSIVVISIVAVRLVKIASRRVGLFLVTHQNHNEKRVNTLVAIFQSISLVLILLTATLTVLSELGVNIAPLLAGAGVVGIAIGFGAQSLVKDLFYGFFILAENQFGIGDVIQVGESIGLVEKMSFRIVTLRDLDGRAHIIPNGEITKVIVFSKEWARINLNISVSYETDLDHAFTVIEAVGLQLHQDWPDLLTEAPQVLGVEELGDNGVIIKVIGKTQPLKQWDVSREYRKRLKKAFEDAGIEIPFPQHTLHVQGAIEGASLIGQMD